MDLHLTRNEDGRRADGIFSSLSRDDDHSQISCTLEHSYPSETGFVAKLQPGTYDCVRGKHRLHGMEEDFETFEITGVPGHSGMLFHWGNKNAHSMGCVLTGDAMALDLRPGMEPDEMVTNSRVAFGRFMDLQAGLDRFKLTVVA